MTTIKAPESKTPVIQIVSPRTIPGILTTNNKGAIDWGWQSFVAYGCFNHVIIIDTQNIKVFQTLQKHKGEVTKVKWSKESFYHDVSNPYTLKLASSDNMGCIVIWDVKMAKSTAVLSEGSKPIADMEWVSAKDACQNLLVALQPPYSVILWNTESGAKIWKKSYTETLISFAFDPFMDNNMTFLASKCILFVDDFNTSKTPSSNGRKFYISNPSSVGSHHSTNSVGNNMSNDDRPKSTSRSILPKRMRFLVKADSKSSNTDDGVTLNECLQLSYHRSYRHHLLLLYPREVLILDLEINQTVGIVSSDHNGSPMMQLYSCWQRDVFFILHENGSISFRLRHRGHMVMAAATPAEAGDYANSNDASLEVTYDLHCQSDALRLTKHGKIIGMAICPISETKVALLVSDGRLLFFELLISHKKHVSCCFPPYLSDTFEAQKISESLNENFSNKADLLPFSCKAVHPASVLSDHISPALYSRHQMYKNVRDSMKFKLFITGVTSVLAAPPHVIRMCPPVTFRNWTMYQPLMAVGNASGSIQVVNMATGIIEKEFSVHTSPVRGIEWIGLTSFLSYAHPNTISILGHVRNELVITDVQSGRTRSLRTDSNEESPIEMLRVSYSRQYAVIVFKEEPFELWDLRSLTLLKIMPKNFPSVSALEWYPRPLKKARSVLDFSSRMKDFNSSNFDQNSENDMTSKPFTYPKENFIFTDTNGQLYSFSVEGNIVTDGHPVPTDIAMGSTTCIAWKGNYIVLGDVDGNLVIYNDEGSNPKTIPTLRGWIKKIRFGPGKGNTKILVLYNDGVDLWDAKNGMIIHQIHCPREMPKVQDIDWAATDRPALATSDGCIRITDIPLKFCSSPLQDYEPSDYPFSPHILSSKMGLFLKSFLLHQLGKEKFSFAFDQQNSHDVLLTENQLKSLCPQVRSYLEDSPPFGIAECSLHVSRIFGDEESLRFWTVALHFLKEAKLELTKGKRKENNADTGNFDAMGDSPSEMTGNLDVFFDQPLDTGFDVYCDNETYKRLQIDRVSLHVHKRTTHNQTQQCAEHLLLLGQTDKAVQLLLETEASNENFYVDSLRACLIATVQSSGTSQSIIKLVSTNLIVNGHIMEGVQLLCLIDKGVDACRYLQGSGRWDQAVWLAKSTLPQNECQEILKRWVDHLCSPAMNQKYKGILILLSMHQFWKIIQLLHSFHMVERAALFLQACLEFGVISRNRDNTSVIDEIFMDYAKYLLSIKNQDVAIQFWKHVSDKTLKLDI